MENRSDYEKRLGEKLEAAYMLEDIGPGMSREEFHRLILAAEKKKKRRRSLLGLAAACVALCLVCGGFVAGMTMRESASAGKDDETKTVQQGGSVVIGNGASENNQNVGVSTKTYTDIEDIPEDVRKKIHFLDSDEFELEKVKVTIKRKLVCATLYYSGQSDIVINEEQSGDRNQQSIVIHNSNDQWYYRGEYIYREMTDESFKYMRVENDRIFCVRTKEEIDRKKIEAIFSDLLD